MGFRVAVLLLLALIGGCAGSDGRKFTIAFPPFTSALDPKAQQNVEAAAAFANAHSLMPLSILGYPTRPDPNDADTLREQRVAVVRNELVRQGVAQFRIEVLGTGIIYPEGVPMPGLPADQVDISVGL